MSIGNLSAMLQDINKHLKDPVMQMIIFGLIGDSIDQSMERLGLKDKTKIGVFGPYPNGGEVILHTIARKVADRNFVAIMGSGFYEPKNPQVFHEMTELLTPKVQEIVALPMFDFWFYRKILPSIVDKAITNLYPLRTNIYELEGCDELNKPVLGYIIHSKVSTLKKDCPLFIEDSVQKTIWQCVAKTTKPCPWQSAGKPHCAFTEVCDVPLVIKRLFTGNDNWTLIAFEDIGKIDSPLDKFLH